MSRQAGKGARAQLLIKLASEVADPTAKLPPHLMHFSPAAAGGGGDKQQPQQQKQGDGPGGDAAAAPPSEVAADQQQPQQQKPPRFRLQHYTAKTLPEPLMHWCFQLVKDTLHDLYLPVWGWSDADKRKQLAVASSRFVVAFLDQEQQPPSSPSSSADLNNTAPPTPPPPPQQQQAQQQQEGGGPGASAKRQEAASAANNSAAAATPTSAAVPKAAAAAAAAATEVGALPVGMVNFRFEPGYAHEPALYLYEVAVDPSCQRLGLASHMVALMEALAWETGMDTIVLTEFTENKAAAALYRRLGFTVDKASPTGKGKGYEILSKPRPSSSSSSGGKSKGGGGKKK